jgi:hypothetical protein
MTVSSLQWNHVSGDDAASLLVVSFHNERAFTVDALRPANDGLGAKLNSNAPPVQAKMRFPTRTQSGETTLFKLSIASV